MMTDDSDNPNEDVLDSLAEDKQDDDKKVNHSDKNTKEVDTKTASIVSQRIKAAKAEFEKNIADKDAELDILKSQIEELKRMQETNNEQQDQATNSSEDNANAFNPELAASKAAQEALQQYTAQEEQKRILQEKFNHVVNSQTKMAEKDKEYQELLNKNKSNEIEHLKSLSPEERQAMTLRTMTIFNDPEIGDRGNILVKKALSDPKFANELNAFSDPQTLCWWAKARLHELDKRPKDAPADYSASLASESVNDSDLDDDSEFWRKSIYA